MGSRHLVHIPGEPQEIHPWNQDGLCRPEEETRAGRYVRTCVAGPVLNPSVLNLSVYTECLYLISRSHFVSEGGNQVDSFLLCYTQIVSSIILCKRYLL
jgi:hypothetical protein